MVNFQNSQLCKPVYYKHCTDLKGVAIKSGLQPLKNVTFWDISGTENHFCITHISN